MGKKNAIRIKQIGPKGSAAAAQPLLDPSSLFAPPEEEIHLPVPPDRSYQIQWPLSLAMLNKQQPDINVHDYRVVYPSYLDATKTVAEGRRIAASDALQPAPITMDLSLALQRLNIPHVIQPYKGYSRDKSVWDNAGRVMVLKSKLEEQGITNKTMLLRKLSNIIQDLPERQARLEREQQEQDVYEQEAAEYRAKEQQQQQQASATSKLAAVNPSSNKTNKKSKKNRK